jgi:hypothetical protein
LDNDPVEEMGHKLQTINLIMLIIANRGPPAFSKNVRGFDAAVRV